MNIKYINIEKVIPYDNNPRKKLNVDKVANSIKEYGWQQPIVVDIANVVIVGHTRLASAKKLGLKEVPILVANLPPEKAKAYRIADNRLNEDSAWDFSLLNKEITELLDLNYDLENLGFDPKELENLVTFPEKDEKEFEEITEDLKTKHTCPSCGFEFD